MIRVGAYAKFDGLYRPITEISLSKDDLFLHGAIFATTGWGKTMRMKHLIQEILSLDKAPSVMVFNLKYIDFYGLENPLQEDQKEKIFNESPDARELWATFKYEVKGIPADRVTYYPIGKLGSDRPKTLPIYSIKFSDVKGMEGEALLHLMVEEAGLYPASLDYLASYFHFFKNHLTQHPPPERRLPDTLDAFIRYLREAYREARNRESTQVLMRCPNPLCAEQFIMPMSCAEAIVRALDPISRLGVFDVGDSISPSRLCIPGHVHVIDVEPLTAMAREIFVRCLLHDLFEYIDKRKYDPNVYQGIVIFLDEAWRFFQSEKIMERVEYVVRMGRSLQIGLWLADQTVPTGVKQKITLNQIHTWLAGTMTIGASDLKSFMPLEAQKLEAIKNLPRGMAYFFNIDWSRMTIPIVVPLCRCHHAS